MTIFERRALLTEISSILIRLANFSTTRAGAEVENWRSETLKSLISELKLISLLTVRVHIASLVHDGVDPAEVDWVLASSHLFR